MQKTLIVTLSDDLHAYIIRDILKKRFSIKANLIEVDKLMNSVALRWYSNEEGLVTLACADKELVNVQEIDLIWWRRSRADQTGTNVYNDAAVADLVNQDWRGSLRGTLLQRHRGAWVSRPDATDRASFKLVQLDVAQECGFKVPRTLVSNDPVAVREFVSRFPEGVVVKAVSGTRHILLVAHRVRASDLPDDETISVVPAIYQEYIAGTQHIRLNQFGSHSYPFLIDSQSLDWRPNLQNSIKPVRADQDISTGCEQMLKMLDIRMGIFDIKIDTEGQPYFFEVNPQGQFMFLEGITAYPMGEKFAEFLQEELLQYSFRQDSSESSA